MRKSTQVLAFILSTILVLSVSLIQVTGTTVSMAGTTASEASGQSVTDSEITKDKSSVSGSENNQDKPASSEDEGAQDENTESLSESPESEEDKTFGDSSDDASEGNDGDENQAPVVSAMESSEDDVEVEAKAAESNQDISSGNIYCNDSSVLYRITGTSRSNYVEISGGRETKPIKVDLNGVNIDLHNENDGDSVEAAPITVRRGSYAIIYVGKDESSENYLYGGNEHGVGKNWGYAGICIEDGAHVTITGYGKLTVHGGGEEYGGAGIGGNYDQDLSDLVIEGDVEIDATGAHSAPGIGAGRDGELFNLTIKGGSITAQGGKYAPGIGAGDAVGTGSGGNTHGITISSGMIVATGGYHAAGIGGSEGGKVENITISGGIITATGGENGAGIGSEGGDCSNITITGGQIKATGGENGAGIGSGQDAKMSNITITNGVIEAIGGKNAAGIGAGNHVGEGDGGNLEGLTITGGSITATGGENGAGIGGSDGGTVSNLKIDEESFLEITAQGGKKGAGIGSANSVLGDISIALNSGEISASGGEAAAGIGGGNANSGKISITGKGTIKALGGLQGTGIGGGEDSTSGDITITGSEGRSLNITAIASYHNSKETNEAAAIGSGRAACGNITIKNATLELKAGQGGAEIGTGTFNGLDNGSIDTISLDNCKIKATGEDKESAGIGAGYGGEVKNIIIKNCDYGGATIGSSSYANHFMTTPNNIESIYIEGSTIYAQASAYAGENWAGIGSGPWGSVDSITIKDSNIDAYATKGGAGIGTGGWDNTKVLIEYFGGQMGDIKISGSDVKASSVDGGAGIGGGISTSAGDITIEDSTVSATSKNKANGGAGIGGGSREGADNIKIINSDVTANGGNHSAGIGTGGGTSLITTILNTEVKGIYISDHSKVTANGGEGGAGIGTGIGGRVSDGIEISDSEITANGGKNAAGIGGGGNGGGGRGADLNKLKLEGKCKITANGGEGGAGIGGGMDGAAHNITINLTTTPDRKYYVKATGGKGAAGIGSGGVEETGHEVLPATGHEMDTLTITGGYVVARGGGLLTNDLHTLGSGAGIGGGARMGILQHLTINGGYVEAYAGGTDACDIGHGGSGGLDTLIKDKNFVVNGGTVIANKWSDKTTPVISGGSVSANISNVKNSAKTNVYRTTLTLADEANTLVDNLDAVDNSYGVNDIFSDSNKRIYLYLPKSDDMKSWADVTVDGDNRHYYGTTSTDGNGVLKMDGVIEFSEPEEDVIAGRDFVMKLKDSALSGIEFEFEATGSASVSDVQQAASPGATVKLHADDFGEYCVTAEEKGSADNPVYWRRKGEYKGVITVAQGSISIIGNPSKTYDGAPVENPEVEKNSDGKVAFTYYKGTEAQGEALSDAPVNAGTYTIVATMEKSEHYTEAESEPYTFTIEKREISLGLSAKATGTEATLTTSVMGAVDACGSIKYSIKKSDGNTIEEIVPIVKQDDDYIATLNFNKVSSEEYCVTAEYEPATPDNYTCVNDPQKQTYEKDKAIRSIEIPDVGTKTYGDEEFNLNASTSDSLDTDRYSYEVVYDEFPNLEDVVTVNQSGKVTIQNAGLAYIKVTLTDTTGKYYNDAVDYVRILVGRTPLHVSSYAELDGKKVTQAQYGTLDKLTYGIEYASEDFRNGDTYKDFNNGMGTLEAVPLINTLEVSDSPYEIGISKVGSDYVIGDKTYHHVYISRNYNLVLNCGGFTVTPAELKIQADDVQVKWNTEPNYTYKINGLVSWDDEEAVFDILPEVSLDTAVTNGMEYSQLVPGKYPNALSVSPGELKKNTAGKVNYSVKTVAGDLEIDKVAAGLEVEVESKVYDGKPVTISVSTVDGYDGTVKTTYYKVESDDNIVDGKEVELQSKDVTEEGPVNAGTYCVECTAAETDYYLEETARKYVVISKADPDPDSPSLPDIVMKKGLTLKAQKLPDGWEWANPDTKLKVGGVRALAIYTPEDTDNYNTVSRYLTFNVVKEGTGSDDNTNPTDGDNSDNESSTNNNPLTGDDAHILLWAVILVIAGGAVGALIIGPRKK